MRIQKGKLAALLCAALLLPGCTFQSINNSGSGLSSQTQTPDSAQSGGDSSQGGGDESREEPTTEPENRKVRMVAVGDNLIQTAVLRAAQSYASDATYDFRPCYENVKSYIQAGDVAVINQETLIANDEYEITGSNFNFNSPTQVGEAILDAGFNVITVSNNHMLDKGVGGLTAAMNYWDNMRARNDITVVGAYRNKEDLENIRIREVNGVKMAFLAFTEHTNGIPIPKDTEIQIILTSDTETMKSQIRAADAIADVVVVSVHWGVEDSFVVSDERREMAQDFVDWGADVILGTHTHTAETMEYLTREDGTQGFVFYSLGNFISAQTDSFNMLGEMADFDIIVDGQTGEVLISDVKVIPVITHYDDGKLHNLRLYPYSMYTEELANSHGLPYAPLGTAKTFNMDVLNKYIQDNIPVEFQKLD